MTRQLKDETFDFQMRLKDAGLIAASAAAQVGGSAKILDVGLGARLDARVVIDITAIEVDSANELYSILVQGSDSPTFAGTTHQNLGAMLVGVAGTSQEGVSSAVGRREIAFCNEVNGHVFQYIRVFTIVAGTIATGINYVANLFKKV